jgi:hypothetical protein
MRKLVLFEVDGVLLEPATTRRLPGTAEALAGIRHGGDAVLTVLTSADQAEARHRITVAGLERYLDLDVGAYGVTDDRAAAVDASRSRAAAGYGCPFEALVVTPAEMMTDGAAGMVTDGAAGMVTDGAGAERGVDSLLDVVPLTRAPAA